MTKADRRNRKRQGKAEARQLRHRAWRRARRRRLLRVLGIWIVLTGIGIGGVAAIVRSGSRSSSASPTTVPASTTTLDRAVAKVKCNDRKPKNLDAAKPTFPSPPAMQIDPNKTYTATLETSCGDIVVALDAKAAPNTVNNFVFLARKGFYDGITWHRVGTGFVVQTGDPNCSKPGDAKCGSGGPGYQFADELPKDNYQIGSVAMANSGPNTNGSQFFIVTGQDGAALPHLYSRFGKVVKGIDVARRLESFAPTGPPGKPTRPLYIFKVTIDEK